MPSTLLTPAEVLKRYPWLKGRLSAGLIGCSELTPVVIHACRDAQIMDIRLFSNDEDARRQLAAEHSIDAIPLAELDHVRPHVLINCSEAETPATLAPAVAGGRAIDLLDQGESEFLEVAKEQGYRT